MDSHEVIYLLLTLTTDKGIESKQNYALFSLAFKALLVVSEEKEKIESWNISFIFSNHKLTDGPGECFFLSFHLYHRDHQ